MVALACGHDMRASKKTKHKKQVLSRCTNCTVGNRSGPEAASGACLFGSSLQDTCLFETQQSS